MKAAALLLSTIFVVTAETGGSISRHKELVAACPEIALKCRVPIDDEVSDATLSSAFNCVITTNLAQIAPGICKDFLTTHLQEVGDKENHLSNLSPQKNEKQHSSMFNSHVDKKSTKQFDKVAMVMMKNRQQIPSQKGEKMRNNYRNPRMDGDYRGLPFFARTARDHKDDHKNPLQWPHQDKKHHMSSEKKRFGHNKPQLHYSPQQATSPLQNILRLLIIRTVLSKALVAPALKLDTAKLNTTAPVQVNDAVSDSIFPSKPVNSDIDKVSLRSGASYAHP